VLASLAMAGTTGGGVIVSAQEAPALIVGSDGFYESVLTAEIYAQALEAQGNESQAAWARQGYEAAFANADVTLESSRF